MNERRSEHRDRRKTVRHDAVGRIRWRRTGSDWYAAGYLSDRSSIDLSFIASRANEPVPDDEIELRTPDRDRQFARVTRVASYDDELSLVACRVVAHSDERCEDPQGSMIKEPSEIGSQGPSGSETTPTASAYAAGRLFPT